MLFKNLIAVLVATAAATVSALPRPGGNGGSSSSSSTSTSTTSTSTSTTTTTPAPTATSFTLTTNSSANALVYLSPSANNQKIYLFNVGTSFSNSDYTTFGKALAASGVAAIILDYSPGNTFKYSPAYYAALSTTLDALKAEVPTWASKYGVKATADASGILVGGHSAGGKAVIDYANSVSTYPFFAVANWDPVDGNTVSTAMSWNNLPHLILHPVNSGCTGQISESNNGVHYYNLATAGHATTLQQYQNTNIHHNSITSSGTLGNLVCSGTVTGLQADQAAKFAAFASNPSGYVSSLTNSTTGTWAYKFWTK